MTSRFLLGIGWTLWATSLGCAATINSFDIELGSWNGSTFSTDYSIWNTFDAGNWAVGATEPGFGNPLLNGFNSVDLADGEYYLYMASADDTSAQAVQITLGYSSGPVVEVFTDPSGVANSGTYTLVSGAGFTANLVTGPQTANTTVGSGQVYDSTGEANWVIDLNPGTQSPEPASMTLLGVGFMLLAVAHRKFIYNRSYLRR